MDPDNNKLTFSLPYHFLKLENKDQESDKINYTIKNHFNTPVIQIKQVQTQADGDNALLELHASDLKSKKGNSSPKVLFHIILTNQLNCPDDTHIMKCELTSTSGEIMSRAIAKDMGSYSVMDHANMSVLQVNRECILEEQYELQIKLVFKEDVIARIKVDAKKIILSVAPELDSITKARLICLMMMVEMVENRKMDFGK